MFTVTGSIRRILLDPYIRQIIVCNTDDNATNFTNEIRHHFSVNDKFRELYPNHAVINKSDEGSSKGFTTPARTRYRRGQSVEPASVKKSIVSRHCDLIIFDDLVDGDNTNTTELRQKVRDNYDAALALIDEKTPQGIPWHYIIGTRWHMADLYADLLETPNFRENFRVAITSVYRKLQDDAGEEYFDILFPEEFPMSRINFERGKNEALFSCHYLNNPVPGGQARLDPKYLQYYEQKPEEPLRKVITIDAATSVGAAKGDPSVIGCYAMDVDGNIYLLELIREWFGPEMHRIADAFVGMFKRHPGVRQVGIEGVGFQKWLKYYFHEVKVKNKLYFEPVEMKRDPSVRKQMRQDRCIPFVQNRRFFVPVNLGLDSRGEKLIDAVKKEMLQFPKGRHDDFLDTLTDAIELLKPPVKIIDTGAPFRQPPRFSGTNVQTGYSYRA